MKPLDSAFAELRAGVADDAMPYLAADETAALLDHIDRLHAAVLAAEDRPESWSATVADMAAEIRTLESEVAR